MDAALLFFGFLWALLGGKNTTPETSPPPRQLPPAPSGGGGELASTPPWPQVVPAGLPSFPGSGWEFDEPPPVAVQQRAQQLVSPLWARGKGTWKTEQTAGRWITYQAQIVASGKKGVVAYRVKQRALPPAPSSSQQTAARPAPAPAPRRTPVARPAMGGEQVSPNAPQTPSQTSRPPASSTSSPAPAAARPPASLPTLSYGMGLKPAAPVPEVVLLQQRLQHAGFKLDADGRFGEYTRVAVIEFQRRTGLAPNQTIQQLQARGFGVVKTATWTKLFEERA